MSAYPFFRRLAGLSVALLAGASSGAFAGVSAIAAISYAPATATSVPTLSEWGLMAMVGLLVLVAYRVLRERLQGKPLASILLAGVLGLGVVSGGYWGRPALAIAVVNSFQFSNSGGGTYLFGVSGDYQGTNTSGVPQRITSRVINVPSTYGFSASTPAPVCIVGMVVPVGGFCNVRIGNITE